MMAYYDPTQVALVSEMLKVCTPQKGRGAKAAQEAMAEASYPEQLRQLQAALMEALQTGDTEAPSPEAMQTMVQALGRLDPKTGDQYLEYGAILRRLLACVDRELMKWTSAPVQPIGPSGEAVVAPFDKPEVL